MMQIFISHSGNKHGPYTTEEIRNRLADGSINPEDFAWYEGLKDWIPVPEVLGIESSQKPTNQQVAIWNPNAAACLSVLFSPLFGSVLVWRNYASLGMDKEAKKSKLWVIGCLVAMVFMWNSKNISFSYIALLIAWYLCDAKKQAKYIKDAFDVRYIKRPWRWPLGIATACLGVLMAGLVCVVWDLRHTSELYRRTQLGDSSARLSLSNSAINGDSLAQFFLGTCYLDGSGVEKDNAEAIKWFRKSADQGLSNAQYNLGLCYQNGTGVEKDDTQAAIWFRKAADQGNKDAQYKVALSYLVHGPDKDDAEAFKWLAKAADNGNEEAMFCLGMCYSKGYAVKKDYGKAAKYFNKSTSVLGDKSKKEIELCLDYLFYK